MRIRMMMVVGIMVSGLGVGWYVMAQNNAALPTFVPGQVLTAEDLNTVVDQVENNTAALSGGASGATIQVDCDAGDSLAQALQGALPGRTIQVSGTCTEQVTITTDRLTLDGQGQAQLVGDDPGQAVVSVSGAGNVILRGFTIRNGLQGILVTGNADVTVENTTVQEQGGAGIIVTESSILQLQDCTVQQSDLHGIVAAAGQVQFAGDNTIRDNNGIGVLLVRGSSLAFSFTTTLGTTMPELEVLRNGAEGIKLISSVATFSGGIVQTEDNGGDGLLLLLNSSVTKGLGTVPFPPGTVITMNNMGHGIRAESGADFSVEPASTLTSQNNGLAGVRLDDGSATISGATITGNGTINGTADVELTFVSKLTLDGSNTIGSFSIDPTSACRDLSTQALCP